jgi:hypothetical protein
MAEDFDNHRRVFDACPERVERTAMIFKAPPQFGQSELYIERPPRDSGCVKRALRRSVLVVSTIQVWHYRLYEKDPAHR